MAHQNVDKMKSGEYIKLDASKFAFPTPRIIMKQGRKYLVKEKRKDAEEETVETQIREWEVLNITNNYIKLQDLIDEKSKGLFDCPTFCKEKPFWMQIDDVYSKFSILEEL